MWNKKVSSKWKLYSNKLRMFIINSLDHFYWLIVRKCWHMIIRDRWKWISVCVSEALVSAPTTRTKLQIESQQASVTCGKLVHICAHEHTCTCTCTHCLRPIDFVQWWAEAARGRRRGVDLYGHDGVRRRRRPLRWRRGATKRGGSANKSDTYART